MPINSFNRILILISFLFLSLNLNLLAQDFLIKKYSADNGLPDNRVNDIVQDSVGRIWIATRTGIASYDGVEWIRYGKEAGVPQVEYIRIKIDEKGIIWFLPRTFSNDFTIIYFENSVWHKLKLKSGLSNTRSALVSFDIKHLGTKPVIFVGTLSNGIIKYKDDRWERILRKNGILSDTVTQVTYWNDKLVVSSLKGLSFVDEKNRVTNLTFDKYGLDSRILAMRTYKQADSEKSMLLLLSVNWMGELLDEKVNVLSRDFNIPLVGINDLSCINYNSAGDILLGNPAKVFYYNKKNKTSSHLVIDDPSSNKGINSILIDYEENIWLAGLRGIYKYRLSSFTNFYKEDGLLENEVTAISEFNSGQLVFGHNYGISIMEGNGFKTINIAKPVTDSRLVRVIDIFHEKESDNIYICSYTNGLGRILSNYKLTWLKINEASRYYSIFSDPQHQFFLSTDGGLVKLNELGELEYFDRDYPKMVRKGLYVNDSLIYLVSPIGLFKWDYKSRIQILADMEANDLFTIFKDDRYGVLVGSISGLYTLKRDSLVKFSLDDNEINESIYFIIKDRLQNLWLGTNNGVLRWDGSKLTRFNKSDGLAGNETNRAAGFVDSKGNVWIGTDEGLSMFTGDELNYEKIKPKIVLLNILDENNISYSCFSEQSFGPDDNSLTFNYRGLSFIDESQNTYEVKLSKLNSDWSERIETAYSYSKFINLSPGEYVFSVRFKNSKGIWSDWQKSSIVTIEKHFYQQPLSIVGSILIFSLLLFYLYDYLQQKKYTHKLEKAVESRTQDLRKNQIELLTSIQRYKGIVDSQTDLVVRVNSEGNLTFVNDAFCNVFGKSRESILGTSIFSYMFSEDQPIAVEEAKRLFIPPHRIKIELRSITTDGIRWYSWEDYAFFDENKNLIEVQGLGRDITIQKEIETELERRVRERTSELQSLIQQSPLGILTFDADGYLIDFNESANILFGNLNDYLPPNRLFNIFEDEFLLQHNYQNRLKELHSSNSQLITHRIHINNSANSIYKNLFSHYLIYRLYSVGFENQKNIIVLLLEDVTDLQKSEENAKKLSEEKLRITTIIKTIEAERERISKELHDGVGQMLTAAKLKLDIFNFKTELDKKEVKETIDILIDAGDEIRRIINDLKPSDVENFGLVSAIEMICKRVQEISGIKTHCNIKGSIQFKNKTDEVVLYRIIQEAFNNIIKHSKCKNAGIDFTQDGNFVQINIWDDGIGISEAHNNGKPQGFGIQNMMSRAKLLGAEIKIVPSEKGTSVNIKIPV